jgi:hypothetical protein
LGRYEDIRELSLNIITIIYSVDEACENNEFIEISKLKQENPKHNHNSESLSVIIFNRAILVKDIEMELDVNIPPSKTTYHSDNLRQKA